MKPAQQNPGPPGAQGETRRPLAEGGPYPVEASAWLAAIVENSSDAIVSKTLSGIITSWNAGATRLFGFAPEEAIGRPIAIIIPEDRLHEEDAILRQLRNGEHVSHFETIRRAKDGTLVPVELTISPVRDRDGRILGASKIARDISERKRLAERQTLLLREMNHRIRNLFTIAQGLVRFCRKDAVDVDAFSTDLCARITALDAAHRLILPAIDTEGDHPGATLPEILGAILAPYGEAVRIALDAGRTAIGANALTSLALLLHELATNAVKYGALSVAGGRLTITGEERADAILLFWVESGGAPMSGDKEGFGTALQRSALQALGGSIDRRWTGDALEIRLVFSRERLAA